MGSSVSEEDGTSDRGETTSGSGLEPNLAGALSYLLGIVTGVVFFVVDEDDSFVRFHAAQSIVVSVVVIVLNIVLSIFSGIVFAIAFAGTAGGAFGLLGVVGLLFNLIWGVFGLVVFAAWLYLMYTAYQGNRPRLPVVGQYAEQLADR